MPKKVGVLITFFIEVTRQKIKDKVGPANQWLVMLKEANGF
jgi:hypothetical protein